MDSINSILGNKEFKEPEAIQKLKDYIHLQYGSRVRIRLTQKGLTIIVDGSALANTLKLRLPDIKRQLDINDNIYIRIG
ncbi:MAG: hypothetical protein WDN66_02200 [Candidatus Saccharibacteria bacterium]